MYLTAYREDFYRSQTFEEQLVHRRLQQPNITCTQKKNSMQQLYSSAFTAIKSPCAVFNPPCLSSPSPRVCLEPMQKKRMEGKLFSLVWFERTYGGK